ncbi:MAG: LacI family DNA-binding transcriptional regulator [Bryobacteraceae bacterium]
MENVKRAATFLEVARSAKVSAATVTRVAAGRTGVSPEIEARVRRAAKALGVDLHRKSGTNIVAFFLSNRDVLHPFQARILLGAESYCSLQGWEILFLSFRYPLADAHTSIQLPQIVSQGDLLRGVILGGTNTPALLQALKKRNIPVAVAGNNVLGDWNPAEWDVVSSDDVTGAHEVTADLIAQGHRAIWYIGDVRMAWFAHCAEGYTRAMREAGLEPHIKGAHAPDHELGYLAAKSILSHNPVTAIFAGNDQVAVGVYRALGEAGISIPSDVSVAGFNDTASSSLFPSLTSVREFPEQLGQHLAELLLRRIATLDAPVQQILLPTQMVRRESSGPPSSGRGGKLDERQRPSPARSLGLVTE